MDKYDFDNMSMDELKALRVQLDRAMTSFEDRKRREALAAAEQAAREHGFALAELTGKATRGRRAQGAPRMQGEAKYANPADPSQTWSGRGRRPQWIKDQVDSGRALEDMAI